MTSELVVKDFSSIFSAVAGTEETQLAERHPCLEHGKS